MKFNHIFSALAITSTFIITPFSAYGDKGETSGSGGMDSEISAMRSMSVIPNIQMDFITDTDLQVHFNQDLGTVSIQVRDTNGFLVITKSFDTSADNETTISTWGWAAGSYRMTIVNIENQIIHNENFMVN